MYAYSCCEYHAYSWVSSEPQIGTQWELRKFWETILHYARIYCIHALWKIWRVNEFLFSSSTFTQIFVLQGSVYVHNTHTVFSQRQGLRSVSLEPKWHLPDRAGPEYQIPGDRSTHMSLNTFIFGVCAMWEPLRAQGPSSLGQSLALFKRHFLFLEIKMHHLDWIYAHGEV